MKTLERPTKQVLRTMNWPQRKLIGQWELLKLQHVVLFWRLWDPRDGEEVSQLVVPVSLRWVVYETQRDHGGHFHEGTIVVLKRSYYWPAKAKDMKCWVQ